MAEDHSCRARVMRLHLTILILKLMTWTSQRIPLLSTTLAYMPDIVLAPVEISICKPFIFGPLWYRYVANCWNLSDRGSRFCMWQSRPWRGLASVEVISKVCDFPLILPAQVSKSESWRYIKSEGLIIPIPCNVVVACGLTRYCLKYCCTSFTGLRFIIKGVVPCFLALWWYCCWRNGAGSKVVFDSDYLRRWLCRYQRYQYPKYVRNP